MLVWGKCQHILMVAPYALALVFKHNISYVLLLLFSMYITEIQMSVVRLVCAGPSAAAYREVNIHISEIGEWCGNVKQLV